MPSLERTLPLLNALLNAASALLALRGYAAIRRGHVERHRRSMLLAAAASAAFLASYLLKAALFGTTPYGGTGAWRAAYLAVLSSHTVLAAVTTPLVIATLLLGLRGRRGSHRRLARWTLPLWLYVSFSGVAVYLLLRPYYGPLP